MTISELIKKGKMTSNIIEYKRLFVVNVGFINNFGDHDETQLDLKYNPATKYGMNELSDLFNSLSEEFDTTPKNVTDITIVASADSQEELESMGY